MSYYECCLLLMQGCLLGQYQELPGLYNGCQYYKQLNSYQLSFGFLYRALDGCWVVGNDLSGPRKLKCEVRVKGVKGSQGSEGLKSHKSPPKKP